MPESKIDQDDADQITKEFEEIYTDASSRIEQAQEAFWGYFEGSISFKHLGVLLANIELKKPFRESLLGLDALEMRHKKLR